MLTIGNRFNPCAGCTACCRYVIVPIDEPEDKSDFDQILWYLLHENIGVIIDSDDDWQVEFRTVCSSLQPDGLCSMHLYKPQVCKDHEPVDCEGKSDATPYVHYFTTPDQFVAYMEERGWRREGFGLLTDRQGTGKLFRPRKKKRRRRAARASK